MGTTQRIRTEIGINKRIDIELEQDFDFLEILSLKIQQEEIYTKSCSGYGVIVGRITANNGFGIPNARVSVFIPITDQDKSNPLITSIYPYTTPDEKNEDGYRYNLLPYEQSHAGHTPTGTFPSRRDALTNKTAIEIYDKYYKYVVKTNESGDYMIMGAPLGVSLVFLDLDLSDMGEFSLTPQDLIRMGRATESQVNGPKFKSSTNLNSLPQIVSLTKSIDVVPLWGDQETCQIAISRCDFDLRDELNIDIQPTGLFMGSMTSTLDQNFINQRCKPRKALGEMCSLVAGPGQIVCIRQTINIDNQGRPILEEFKFPGGNDVIEDDGSWLVDLPMNLDYIITNEFGEKVISDDPKVGIPTKGKYRFKIKWKQPDDLGQQIKRAYYLVPNVSEYGWGFGKDPADLDPNNPVEKPFYDACIRSYGFSLDWNDYGDTGTTLGNAVIQRAIDCEDKFYELRYNQVYTVSQLIDLYQKGTNRRRFIGIKDIQNQSCESSSYKFPMNDGVRGVDILFTLFNFILGIFTTPILSLVPMLHLLRLIWPIIKVIIVVVFTVIMPIIWLLCQAVNVVSFGLANLNCPRPMSPGEIWRKAGNPFSNMKFPMITYPECEMCDCTPDVIEGDADAEEFFKETYANASQSCTIDTQSATGFANVADEQYCKDDPLLLGVGLAPCNELLNATNNVDLLLQLMQQNLSGSMKESYSKRTPNLVSNSTIPYPNGFFSQDLTLSERLNLFNLKGKYFNDLQIQGGGDNQIKVSINPQQNPGKVHYDNVIALLIDNSCVDNFPIGGLISFNNISETYDLNVLSGKTISYVDIDGNVVTTNAITGTATNNGSVTIKYADPLNSNNLTPLTTTYSVDQSSAIDFSTRDIVGYPTGEYGDDSNTVFSLSLNTLLLKGTLVVYSRTISGFTETFTDNSNGVLTSNLGGTGTVEYTTGNIFLNFDVPPANNSPILADYIEFVPANTPNSNKHFITHKFPTDIEYFQVITATTYGSFVTQNPPIPTGQYNNPNPAITPFFNSLKYRYTDNFQTVWSKKFTTYLGFQDGEYYDTDDTFRPIYTMPDQKEFIVVFLMRGVDPYSARVPMDIDISKLMGQSYGTNIVSGNYKMNIPVQPGLVLPRHNQITSPNSQSPVGQTQNGYIFYPSYCYNTSSEFSGFTTYNTSNYSSLDKDSVSNFTIDSNISTTLYSNRVSNTPYLGVGQNNVVSLPVYPRIGGLFTSGAYGSSVNPNNYLNLSVGFRAKQHRGYYTNEYVEGGSYVYLNQSSKNSAFIPTLGIVTYPVINQGDYYYYSPVYATGATPTVFTNADTRLVMRCDRLPSSSNRTDGYGNNTFVLHQNRSLAIYSIADNGSSVIGSGELQSTGYNSGDNQEDEPSEFENSLQSSFSCSGIVPLKCYQGYGTGFGLARTSDKCYDKVIAENGCYVLLRGAPFITLPRDYRTFAEWLSRFRVMMASCRGIFSHNFVNNWINGTLFFYTFKNNRFFRNAGAGRNQPYNRYCRDTIILHNPTSNFYYRSSPTTLNPTSGVIKFVGKAPTSQGGTRVRKNGRNSLQLQAPTTIMNLGPRDEFAYQLTLSADYYGYNVDKMEQTSYKEFENILNLFIISRLRSSGFFSNLTRTGSGSVAQFFSRKNSRFDGDYAQSISVNSEHGVDEFDFDSYDYSTGTTTGGNTYYIGDRVMGIFYSSDTQTRDYITPRRIIRNDTTSPAQYDNLGFTSQVVPFYRWKINNPPSQTSTFIFGDQKNEWQTGLKDVIQNTRYQSLDRVDVNSYYFMGETAINEYYKGFIYNVRANNTGGYDFSAGAIGPLPNTNTNLKYLVGAPFHFYFGLTRGSNALDKFRVKFLGVETI
jgi:hypothetical protein